MYIHIYTHTYLSLVGFQSFTACVIFGNIIMSTRIAKFCWVIIDCNTVYHRIHDIRTFIYSYKY